MLDARSATARILVVEDEVLIQMLVIDYLEELGCKAEIAGSAADARSKLRLLNGEIDAAIIDVELPDGRGDELVIELRAISPMLPIVIASGHDEASFQRQFVDQRGIGFLSKPFDIRQLCSALRSLGTLS